MKTREEIIEGIRGVGGLSGLEESSLLRFDVLTTILGLIAEICLDIRDLLEHPPSSIEPPRAADKS